MKKELGFVDILFVVIMLLIAVYFLIKGFPDTVGNIGGF